MSDLPPEIIRAVLSRLPVKSLLRFRCVSKPWRSLIDGQDFIKLHLRHSTETNSNRTLVVESTKLFYVDLDSFERLDTGNIRFKPRYVAGSCNGLILIVSDSNDIVLWNPCTRQRNELPLTPLPMEFVNGVFCCRQEGHALGYDSKHDDYKVVRVVQAIDWVNGGFLCSETKIYSLETNSWKKVEGFPYKLNHSKTWGVYLNDALHTVVELVHNQCCDAIMAFDLANEEHYEVPKPEFSGVSRSIASVDVIGGCLAAVFSGETNDSEIWVMKEYGVKGSWCKLICFDPSSIPEPCVNLFPLAYSKSGDEVLLNDDGNRLIWYNLGKKTVTVACVEGLSALANGTALDPLYDAWVCVASLVSPYSPGGVGIKKQNPQQGKKGKEIKKKRDDFLSVGFKLVL